MRYYKQPVSIVAALLLGLALHAAARADELVLHTGPIVGWTGTDFFTVTCRTTVPAVVTLKVGEKTCSDKTGLTHTLRMGGLQPGTAYEYTLSTAAEGEPAVTGGPYRVKTYPAEGKLIFAATGDSRSDPKTWGLITAAIQKVEPAFVLHTGDLVSSGAKDELWDEQFWKPAQGMLASIPFYPVWGNHEKGSNILLQLFSLPGGSGNWSQQVGPVLLVGGDLNGSGWSEGGKNVGWLEETIKASRAPFVFVEVHVPAWSSGSHGNSKLVQTAILPILEKYQVTALVAGHDHNYERSEPGKGTTCITTGGGGAPLYAAKNTAKNPHSKIFRSIHHYVIFTVEGDSCTMNVYTLDGQVLDTRTWKARKLE